MEVWIPGITKVLVTISEILTAGIAIIAFSLLIYALTFNLRNRVAQSFAVILFCVVIIFSAEAFGSTSQSQGVTNFWLHVQWIGIIFLPAGFAHFSNSLLSTTGKPSRWRRLWWVRGTYLIALGFLVLLTSGLLLGPVVVDRAPAPYNKQTIFTELYILYYLAVLVLSWVNFVRAYRRTVTKASRRRMSYLIISALGPAFGSFPFLLIGSDFAAQHPATFWVIAILVNLVTSVLLVVMAYAVAFFGVPWPDRVVKSRLIKWLLRGPLTASITLAVVTLVRRGGDAFGYPYTALVPIIMVVNILVCEHAITLLFPKLEQLLLFGNDQQELMQIRTLEERLITRSDLSQFLEMVLSAICDQVQAKGAYLASINEEGIDIAAQTDGLEFDDNFTDSMQIFVSELEYRPEPVMWNNDLVYVLKDGGAKPEIVGYLGLRGVNPKILEEGEIKNSVLLLNHRAAIAMRDSKIQEQVISTLENIDPHVDMIQQLRAVGRYDSKGVLSPEGSLEQKEMAQWIKDALTHYWGGPKLTENPLLNLNIVKQGMGEHDENPTNSLRGILKKAIETIRPGGERRFTGEWLLYNILDLKFLEGKKVKEISRRLAVSEADLYRKQRVAIDAIANEIVKMEMAANKDHEDE